MRPADEQIPIAIKTVSLVLFDDYAKFTTWRKKDILKRKL